MPTKPPFDPSKPPLQRKSPGESGDQTKSQAEQPILAARPSPGRAKKTASVPQGSDQALGSESLDVDINDVDINEETIRKRAYELWEQRGRLEGFQDEDWRRAEAELRGQIQQAS